MYSFSVSPGGPTGSTWSFVVYAETWRDLVTRTGFESEAAAQQAAEDTINSLYTLVKVSFGDGRWKFVIVDQFGIEIARNWEPLGCEEAAREAAFRAVRAYIKEIFPGC